MWNNSEIYTMMAAERSKVKKGNGFQGCVNYGNGCDFGGFYLASYSLEGFCHECELKHFPGRYHGCCFCGMALKCGAACWGCEKGFSKWVFDLFYNKNKNSRSTTSILATATLNETNDSKLWHTLVLGIHCLKDELYGSSETKIAQMAGISDNWPGFYMGDNKWYKPDPFSLKDGIDISDITWDNKVQVLIRELKKKGINLDQEIQYSNSE